MKTKIIEILSQYIVTENGTCYCNTEIEDLATEIESLCKEHITFEVACNPDLMEAQTNYKMYQEQIDKLKEIIAKQDELLALEEQFIVDEVIGTIDITGEDDWDAFKNPANALKNKIKQLKNEAGL